MQDTTPKTPTHKVTGLALAESTGAHKKNKVGVDIPVLGVDCASLDEWEEIPLNTFGTGISSPIVSGIANLQGGTKTQYYLATT
jgi:hypothetical protein